ncbi:3'-5' exonuclease [Nocardioides sp. NPDC006303]|uniref:3'-5' exonuclease n=1 Tax=Nocardioides sp. NPDC006303 TaxID=3156747 RepID=UPI0033ACB8AA
MPMVIFAPVKDGGHDPSIGKKVSAFLSKLYADDTAVGLHIEPIKGSADPKVRTGRVDDFYRAVLFKVTGSGQDHYVYTGVWPHDKANEIARTAVLTTNPVNALPELKFVEPAPAAVTPAPAPAVPTPTASSVLAKAQPDLDEAYVVDTFGLDEELVRQAWSATSDDQLLELAERAGGWRGDVLLALAAGGTPTKIREELGLDEQPDVAAGATEDERLLAAMKTAAGQMQFAWLEDDAELRRVIEAGDLSRWRIFLHPEQRTYVEKTYNGPFRLSGGAGTGKTVVLVHRARRLARDNPDARILLTTYTRNLAEGMRRQLKDLDPGVRLASALGEPGIYVAGVDQVANQILTAAKPSDVDTAVERVLGPGNRATGRLVDTDKAWRDAIATADTDLPADLRSPIFFEAEYAAVVLPNKVTTLADYLHVRRPGRGVALNRANRQRVWEVVRAFRAAAAVSGEVDFGEVCAVAAALEAPVFDHVLVDEGQDLSATRWQFLRSVVAPGADDLFLAEDAQQRIYGQRVVLGRYGIKIVGRSRRLTLNYRTTAEVLGFATSILAGEPYVDLEEVSADATGFRSARSGPEPARVATSSLTDELDRSAVVVRGWQDAGVPGEAIGILVRDQRMADRVGRGLEERDVGVQLVTRTAGRSGRPQLMTMHRAKGMEFTHVLIFGADVDLLPAAYLLRGLSEDERADLVQRERSLLYVAATRARDELVVMWEGTPSEFLVAGQS